MKGVFRLTNYKELEPMDLRNICHGDKLGFETTAELTSLEGIIGQGRASAAMEFGLAIKRAGYNIYVSGLTGTGRSSYSKTIINKIAQNEKTPDDWCYIYNFNNPDKPIALSLPAGMGIKLQKDMIKLVRNLKTNVPRSFDSEEYEKQKNEVIQKYQMQSSELMEGFNQYAKQKGFMLKKSEQGLLTIPIKDDNPIGEEDYIKLSAEERKKIEEDSYVVEAKLLETMNRINEAEENVKNKLDHLEIMVALVTVEQPIMELKEKYNGYENVLLYLRSVQRDIIQNIEDFREPDKGETEGSILEEKDRGKEFLKKYQVNLMIDNHETQGAPVAQETNPKYYNLFGKIEYESNMGAVTTDFTKIKPGSLHAANGGYIIINMSDIMRNPESWDALKRAMKTNSISIENVYSVAGVVSSGMKPEPIPLNIKILLIGSAQLYNMLYNRDEDFRKYFKIKADFDIDMISDDENIMKYAKFISSHCMKKNLLHFDNTGVAAVVEYSRRLSEHKHKLSTRFNDIIEVLYEADAWARIDGAQIVTAAYVKKAIKEKYYRSNRIEEKIQDYIDTGFTLISTENKVIGQVNGLSVMDFGDISFGKPSRITAVTYAGEKGIINIEREVEMSGSIHDKGMLILSGYLGDRFAQDFPLSLTSSICFEQLYDGVEGDSASSTELYALLSSLSEIPIKQYIAVTGSVNQRGEIQPIGGVNDKIEGFFQTCKVRGLSGQEGVIIPYQNVVNLMLDEEVVEAVRQNKFHIYAIKNVEDGIEILTDMPAGHRNEKGQYPENSVFYNVQKKLEKFARIMEDIEFEEEA